MSRLIEVEETTNVEPESKFKLIATNASNYLTYLSDYIESRLKVDRIELRLYLEKSLSDDLVKTIESGLDMEIWFDLP